MTDKPADYCDGCFMPHEYCTCETDEPCDQCMMHPDMILSGTVKADVEWTGTPSFIAPNLVRYVPDLGMGGDFRGMEPTDKYATLRYGEWYRAEDVDALIAQLMEGKNE